MAIYRMRVGVPHVGRRNASARQEGSSSHETNDQSKYRMCGVLAAAGALFHTRAGAQDLTAITGEQGVHGMPFTGKGEARRSADGGYTTRLPRRPGDDHATTYAIFWAPSRLQNGQTTSMPRRIKTLAEPGR
jgi:hypothetical protein